MFVQTKANTRPLYRLIFIRFHFLILGVCLFSIALLGVSIWFDRSYKVPKPHTATQEYLSSEDTWRINEGKKCFHPRGHEISLNLQMLEDILETQPKPNNVIFFHETSCIPSGIVQLNPRFFFQFVNYRERLI